MSGLMIPGHHGGIGILKRHAGRLIYMLLSSIMNNEMMPMLVCLVSIKM